MERFASDLDAKRFGIVALYLIGSTKNGNAGPESDIDIIIHARAGEEQQRALNAFIARWDKRARDTYHLRSGMHSRSVAFDAHLVTDKDIRLQTSFAAKIDAITDAAQLIRRYEAEPEREFAVTSGTRSEAYR